MYRTLHVVWVTVCFIASASSSIAVTAPPGKNSVFVSANALALPAAPATLLSGTIAKGKKKKVLAVEAMITNGAVAPSPLPVVLSLRPLVNGVPMEPTTSSSHGAVVDCGYSTRQLAACTLTGSWWLDLDAAELASPGVFIGKPLVITLTGGSLAGGLGSSFDVTLTGRLEAK